MRNIEKYAVGYKIITVVLL